MGASAVLRHAKTRRGSNAWAQDLLQKKPFKLVAVAQANKTARVAWALMTRGGTYREEARPRAA